MSDSQDKIAEKISSGRTSLGIEFGSTRIKAVLIDDERNTIATGDYGWQSHLVDGLWSYDVDKIWRGLQSVYADVADRVEAQYGQKLVRIGQIGFSAMMHGYLAFNEDGELLVPFRTWQNTNTSEAHERLSQLFQYNIPERWSIAHLYQAVLNDEPHIGSVRYFTTLAGYVHWKLTGRKVLGVGDASGMFPIDPQTKTYEQDFIEQFDALPEVAAQPWKLEDLLPEPLVAGTPAGELTAEGAALLDPSGVLQPGVALAPPEGDAGTGMVATGAVLPRTGSISAGTSSFALLVLERELKGCYPEIDVVATPSGQPVAMAHTNTCTSDVDAWVRLFGEFYELMGQKADLGELFPKLFRKALEGEPDCGGLVSFNYFSGEPVTGTETGRPMFTRLPGEGFTLANFMRAQLYGAIATLKLGIDLLVEQEHVETDRLLGHGGFFKTEGVGRQIMADALGVPISTMTTAGEGGPWGMALLAAYLCRKGAGETMEDYLEKVFSQADSQTSRPDPAGSAGFQTYIRRYTACLPAERALAAME